MSINAQREAAGLPPYDPRPKERALIDTINEYGAKTRDACIAMPFDAGLWDAANDAYTRAVRLVVEAELDAR